MSTRRYISSFRIENFGAFYNSGYPIIELPSGENLLAYGENGSGKSSIYKALNQFFESSTNPVVFNINKLLNQPGTVEVTFIVQDDATGDWQTIATDTYNFTSTPPSTNTEHFIRQANKIRGFLSYQQLVKTYALPAQLGHNPNLYELIIEDLLWNHELPVSHKTIQDYWNELKVGLEMKDGRKKEFLKARDKLPAFNADLQALINTILPIVNNWLQQYFKYSVTVTLPAMPPHVSLALGYFQQKQLHFNIHHFGKQYNEYHNFLNEARLSALAICIYLAGIKLNPTGTNYKILFLDDIFIGLDTSNRLPLLEILKIDFSEFQIFMTTYDRNWFELAKEQLNPGKWKLLEMYHDEIKVVTAGGGNVVIGEKPVIIESSYDFLPKANAYFKAKDYPACANYLRKETERLLRKLLPLERRVVIDTHFGTRDETKLENLLNNLTAYIEECAITLPDQTIEAIKLYRTLVLNPQSHSDIVSPIYRAELEKAFAAIGQLSAIPEINRTLVAILGTRFIYQHPANHNYVMELELADNIYKVICGANTSVSKYKFRIVDWNWNGVQYATTLTGVQMANPQLSEFCDKKRTLNQVFTVITSGGHNPMPGNLEQAVTVGGGQTLDQLII